MIDKCFAFGRFKALCFDRWGKLRWVEEFPNTVVTVGKNLALDTYLAGAAYTVTGPFMGLISSVSFSAISAADTMALHAGWKEAGNANAPTLSNPRQTITWLAASAGLKVSNTANFNFNGTGTVKGAFLVFGPGAVATIDSTAGTLYSAGLFVQGDKVVASGDNVIVTYTAGL